MLVVIGRFDIADTVPRGCWRWGTVFSDSRPPFWQPVGSPSLAVRSKSTTGTLAFARCAAIWAPITPAPSTAVFLTCNVIEMSPARPRRQTDESAQTSVVSHLRSRSALSACRDRSKRQPWHATRVVRTKSRGFDDLVFELEGEPHLRAISFHLAG